MEILKRNSKGQSVLTLQCALAAAGLFSGDLDGCFGSGTVESVQAAQRKHNLPATGIVDERTAAVLEYQAPLPPSENRLPAVITGDVARIFPEARIADIELNLPHVLNALVAVGLTSPEYVAMALASIRTETSLFLPISEGQSSLNTSPGGKPFDLYDDHAGLGNKGAHDGSDFRGRGFIQLTGRANYLTAGKAIGLGTELVVNPLRAHDPEIAGKLLANFLATRKTRLTAALSGGNLVAARKVVNGGTAGLQPFLAAYHACMAFLPKDLQPTPTKNAA